MKSHSKKVKIQSPLKKNENISLLEKKVTIFIPFKMNFPFKGIKSYFTKYKILSFEVKIHSKKKVKIVTLFQVMKGDCFHFSWSEISLPIRNLECNLH